MRWVDGNSNADTDTKLMRFEGNFMTYRFNLFSAVAPQ
jgi:hypothetical protein